MPRTRRLQKSLVAQKITSGKCEEYDCGNPVYKESTRCWDCLKKLRETVYALRDMRLKEGKCRCGKDHICPGLKRCFRCVFGIDWPEDDVIDFVELYERAPRAVRKALWDTLIKARTARTG